MISDCGLRIADCGFKKTGLSDILICTPQSKIRNYFYANTYKLVTNQVN
jgi:hypothetical protein